MLLTFMFINFITQYTLKVYYKYLLVNYWSLEVQFSKHVPKLKFFINLLGTLKYFKICLENIT
jgi:hypothetical protein